MKTVWHVCDGMGIQKWCAKNNKALRGGNGRVKENLQLCVGTFHFIVYSYMAYCFIFLSLRVLHGFRVMRSCRLMEVERHLFKSQVYCSFCDEARMQASFFICQMIDIVQFHSSQLNSKLLFYFDLYTILNKNLYY